MGRRPLRMAMAAAALAGAAVAVVPPLRRSLTTPADFRRASYARSDSCLACHPGRYESWHRTYHRTMTQDAGPQAVVGDFADARYTFDGVESLFTREGDQFFVETVGPGGVRGRFAIEMT